MKVIFLDIDGVLNTEVYLSAVYRAIHLTNEEIDIQTCNAFRDGYGQRFDPMAERALRLIIDKTDAKIVISSTWRMSGIEEMQSMWKDRNLPGEVIDVTPCHLRTRFRGNEIKEWLDNNPHVESYLIIDDDSDMLEEQKSNFIQTDFQYGLMIKDIDMAVKILNKL